MNPNYRPRFTPSVVADGLVDRFTVVDVGASGGVATHWQAFGPALRATGFDPLVHEVKRLNAAEKNPLVRYVAKLVGFRRYKEVFPDADWALKPNNNPWARTSSVRAQAVLKTAFAESYDRTGSGEQTAELIELDEYFVGQTVDFLKVDTDGFDIAVLMGGKDLIQRGPVLGIQIEVNFNWVQNDSCNVFRNVDCLLQPLGFSVFDVRLNRYTRAALPGQFEWGDCSTTVNGQVLWADVLYLRDAAIQGYRETWGIELTSEQIVRLACLFELYGLQDCAAELLICYRDILGFEIEPYLDALTPVLHGRQLPFRDYNLEFDRNIEAFNVRTRKPASSTEAR